jgi:hypothetical protein
LTDAERSTLAVVGKRLGHQGLEPVASAAQPDTILAWFGKLFAQKFDGSRCRLYPGRPPIGREITEPIIRIARENSGWGNDRVAGALQILGHHVSDQTVGSILLRFGIAPAPKRRQQVSWADFIRSHMAVLAGIDFFTVEVLTWRGLATYYVLPALSPNLNALAERLVRSIKTECLSKLILFGEGSLRRAVTQFFEHYHLERPHQGKGKSTALPCPRPTIPNAGRLQGRERLGGLLKFYQRIA